MVTLGAMVDLFVKYIHVHMLPRHGRHPKFDEDTEYKDSLIIREEKIAKMKKRVIEGNPNGDVPNLEEMTRYLLASGISIDNTEILEGVTSLSDSTYTYNRSGKRGLRKDIIDLYKDSISATIATNYFKARILAEDISDRRELLNAIAAMIEEDANFNDADRKNFQSDLKTAMDTNSHSALLVLLGNLVRRAIMRNHVPKGKKPTAKVSDTPFSDSRPIVVEYSIDRADELDHIHSLFQERKNIVITGIGGLGKSDLARSYFHKFHGTYDAAGFIRWQGTTATLSDLKRVLSARVLGADRIDGESLNSSFARALAALAKLGDNCLLIIDDVPIQAEPDFLKELSGLPIRILLTSRKDVNDLFYNYPLGELPMEKCKELFLGYARRKKAITAEENDALEDIIERAARHTLTLELLAKLIPIKKLTIQGLLDLIKKQGFNIDNKLMSTWAAEKGQSTPLIILDTYGILLDMHEIVKDSPEAHVLSVMALFPNMNISIKDMLEWMGWTSEEEDIAYACQQQSLLKATDIYYVIHPVISETVRARFPLNPEEGMRLIAGMAKMFSRSPEEHPILDKKYLPFIESALSIWKEIWLQPASDAVFNLLMHAGDIHKADGSYLAAEQYFFDAETVASKIYGDTSMPLVWLYNSLARTQHLIGMSARYKECLKYAEKAHALLIALNAEGSIEMAETQTMLGVAAHSQSKYNESLAHHSAALKRRLAEENPSFDTFLSIVRSWNNVGNAHNKLGQFTEAMESYCSAILLLDQKDSNSSSDWLRANTLTNLGPIQLRFGQVEEALQSELTALQIKLRLFGEISPAVATSYYRVTEVYLVKRDFESASKYNEMAKVASQRDGATYYLFKGRIHFGQGNLEEAAFNAKIALEARGGTQGRRHTELGEILLLLLDIYDSSENYALALEYGETALSIFVENTYYLTDPTRNRLLDLIKKFPKEEQRALRAQITKIMKEKK